RWLGGARTYLSDTRRQYGTGPEFFWRDGAAAERVYPGGDVAVLPGHGAGRNRGGAGTGRADCARQGRGFDGAHLSDIDDGADADCAVFRGEVAAARSAAGAGCACAASRGVAGVLRAGVFSAFVIAKAKRFAP